MRSFSSRIWTRVAVSISYDDNHYTTGPHYLYQLFVLIVTWGYNYLQKIISYLKLYEFLENKLTSALNNSIKVNIS